MTVERRLLERIEQLLAAGEPELPEAAIRKRLEQVIRNAGQLADRAESGPLRLKAMNLQAQAIHARLAGHSDPEEFDRLRHRLRLVALRTKAMSEPAAAAVGDFWRVAAELIELNRTGLPGDVRESHASDVLQDYVNRYPEGPAAPAARAALARLRGDEPVASSATQPATRPATPPTTQPAAQPAVEPAAATTQPAH